jgi:ribosomal protein L15E
MHPTTMQELAKQRQAEYRQEADRHRLAMLARQGAAGNGDATHDNGVALVALRRAFDKLIHPLRTTGTSPA